MRCCSNSERTSRFTRFTRVDIAPVLFRAHGPLLVQDCEHRLPLFFGKGPGRTPLVVWPVHRTELAEVRRARDGTGLVGQAALNDLRSLGVDMSNERMPAPTIATEAFTAYVYRLATTGNPYQRLGYSYWAENCYAYFAPVGMAIVQNMKLEARNLTFFVQHGEIDKKHGEEVRKIISEVASTQAEPREDR